MEDPPLRCDFLVTNVSSEALQVRLIDEDGDDRTRSSKLSAEEGNVLYARTIAFVDSPSFDTTVIPPSGKAQAYMELAWSSGFDRPITAQVAFVTDRDASVQVVQTRDVQIHTSSPAKQP